MTSRKVLILAVAAIVVLGVASLLTHRENASDTKPASALYPDLKSDLRSITAVRVFKAGDTKAVELARKDNEWVVTERAGYPANTSKVNKLLIALSEAKPVEEKTANPVNYPTLGVEDLKAASASGTRIELEGVKSPVNLIVGKSAGTRGAYVRRAGESTSWLIDQSLDVSATPGEWLRTSIIDVSADRVQSVTVAFEGAKPYAVEKSARADADFKSSAIPKGKEADTFTLNGFARALAGLTLSDVRSAKDFGDSKASSHATVRTFDGLVVDVDGWTKDGKHYVALQTSYDEALATRFHVETKPGDKAADDKSQKDEAAAAKPKADTVAETAKTTNDQLQGWVFEIPDYKYEAIFKPGSALLKK